MKNFYNLLFLVQRYLIVVKNAFSCIQFIVENEVRSVKKYPKDTFSERKSSDIQWRMTEVGQQNDGN